MNKKLTDYVIDLVEILNKQQKQVFWGIFDIFSMVVSIIVSYILFYGLINPAPVDYIIYTSLAFLFYQLMIGFWGLNASISRYSKITDFMKIFFGVTAAVSCHIVSVMPSCHSSPSVSSFSLSC
ncbi:nucleoside-diphosphate sugar isomerase [Streptococcus pneumoniae]|nr:nucleoside-diphosphate sugar isomerase [Streptococcus pneumoniae]